MEKPFVLRKVLVFMERTGYNDGQQMKKKKGSVQLKGTEEGSYSCYPTLWEYYDLHIFLSIDGELQLRKISERNKGSVRAFVEKWIPMKEKNFEEFSIKERCRLCFEAGMTGYKGIREG